MSVSERIRALRKNQKLTQKKLAELAGVSEIAIRLYETGKRQPRIEQLQKIAECLGVSVDYLISGEAYVEQLREQVEKYEEMLHVLFERWDKLSEKDRQAIIALSDALAEKNKDIDK